MSWPELILAALNVFQAVAIAWIGSRQQLVKRELQRVNGHLDHELSAVHESVRALHSAAPTRNVH